MPRLSFSRILILLIAFILAASLPFVLRKPVKIDQSTPSTIEHQYITIQMKDEAVDQQIVRTSGTVTWNQGGAGVDHAIVYLFRVDHQAKELVETSRTYTDPQGRFEMLTPAGLELQIFVDPKDAKNVPARLKGKVREEVQDRRNML